MNATPQPGHFTELSSFSMNAATLASKYLSNSCELRELRTLACVISAAQPPLAGHRIRATDFVWIARLTWLRRHSTHILCLHVFNSRAGRAGGHTGPTTDATACSFLSLSSSDCIPHPSVWICTASSHTAHEKDSGGSFLDLRSMIAAPAPASATGPATTGSATTGPATTSPATTGPAEPTTDEALRLPTAETESLATRARSFESTEMAFASIRFVLSCWSRTRLHSANAFNIDVIS